MIRTGQPTASGEIEDLPLNVDGVSSFNIPVEAAKVTDPESAPAIWSVAPAPTVSADAALVPADVVSVAVKAYVPDDKSAVVKLQLPLLLAVVVPSALEPPSDTVTVAPAGARPVKVTESLALTVPLLIAGAAGCGTVTSYALDAALVPADVVSVAVKA